MKRSYFLVLAALASVAAVPAILIGCNNTIVPDGGDGGTGGAGSPFVDSDFTDAPVSPGGTGGPGGVPVNGADDVELPAETTKSFFTAFQVDPTAEDTAGPKFVVAGDLNQDGLTDLVSGWNQSQPVQLHLQQRGPDGIIAFRTITLAGTTPVAVIAGVQLGQINGDGYPDIVVLSKATGFATLCPTNPPREISRLEGEIIIYFNPGPGGDVADGEQWKERILVNPFVADRWIHNQFPGIEFVDFDLGKTQPEWNGFTDLVVADIDGQAGDDILVALNPGVCAELNQDPPTNTVDLWINPGPDLAETPAAWGVPSGVGLSRGVPITLMSDAPQVKDIEVMDVDSDGDLDVVATWTNALSQNVRWARNPLVPHTDGGPGGFAEVTSGTAPGTDICVGGVNEGAPCPNGDADCAGANAEESGSCVPGTWWFFADGWEVRPVGQVDTDADVMALGDVDNDGSDDVLIRSTNGQIIQWFRRPNQLIVSPEFPPVGPPVPDRDADSADGRFNFPWQVFTLTEFTGQQPEAVAIGDLTGDQRNEVVVSIQGGIFWYDATLGTSAFDPWFPNPIIQDSAPQTSQGDGGQDDTENGEDDGDEAAPGSGVGVGTVGASTVINSLLIVDLDGDGRNDIIGTLDRRSGSGLSDDRLVWYRNVRTDDEE